MSQGRQALAFILLYLGLLTLFLALIPLVIDSNWGSSSDFHACIEISSSLIALISAVACLSYFFGLRSRYFIIIGLGFFICGSEDLIHGIFGFKRLFADSNIDFARFIPGTYVTGRLLLALSIIVAAFFDRPVKAGKNLRREAVSMSLIALLIGGGTTALAFSLPLPKFVYPSNIISRPIDFISALIFAIALVLTARRYYHKRDMFTGMLIACILLNIGGQIYMSFSKKLFDIYFDIAHWANILSYCMPALGITLELRQQMEKLNLEARQRLEAQQELKAQLEESRRLGWMKNGQSLLMEKLQGIENMEALAETSLRMLARYLNAHVGLLHVAGKDKTLTVRACYGLPLTEYGGGETKFGEGLAGQAALDHQTLQLNELPPNYFQIKSGLGDGAPRSLVVVPLLFDGKVKGVLELAALQAMPDFHIAFLEQTGERIAIAIEQVHSRLKLAKLLDQARALGYGHESLED